MSGGADPAITDAERVRAEFERRDRLGPESWFDPGHLFLIQQRERRTLRLLRRSGLVKLKGLRVLDIGCGDGYWMRELVKWGADPGDITGVDLVPSRISRGRHLSPEGMSFHLGNGETLPWATGSFDIVLQSTVFSSILDETTRQAVAAEMLRVLAPKGSIIWYDFLVDNPLNHAVRGVRAREIRALFPGCERRLERLTLLPPLARWLARRSWPLAVVLEAFPWVCTHYLGTIRKSTSSGPSPTT